MNHLRVLFLRRGPALLVLLSGLGLCSCFEPDSVRDSSWDAFDQKVGAFPYFVQRFGFDGEGNMHMAVGFGHVFTPSRPSQGNNGIALRNAEIRVFTRSGTQWSDQSLMNWSENLDPYYSYWATHTDNKFDTDDLGHPWLTVDNKPYLERHHWSSGKWRKASSLPSTFEFYSDSTCAYMSQALVLASSGEFFRFCAGSPQLVDTPSANTPRPLFTQGIFFEGSHAGRIPINTFTYRGYGGMQIRDLTFAGDTLHALLESVDSLNTFYWVKLGHDFSKAGLVLSTKPSLWQSQGMGMPLGFGYSQGAMGLVLLDSASLVLARWRDNQIRPLLDDELGLSWRWAFDKKGCFHFISQPLMSQPIDLQDSLSGKGSPVDEVKAGDGIEKDILVYRNSCRESLDTLVFNRPVIEQNASNNDQHPALFLSIDTLDQPWVLQYYSQNVTTFSNSFSYYIGLGVSYLGQSPDTLTATWRKGIRFDLRFRDGQGWKKAELPF